MNWFTRLFSKKKKEEPKSYYAHGCPCPPSKKENDNSSDVSMMTMGMMGHHSSPDPMPYRYLDPSPDSNHTPYNSSDSSSFDSGSSDGGGGGDCGGGGGE